MLNIDYDILRRHMHVLHTHMYHTCTHKKDVEIDVAISYSIKYHKLFSVVTSGWGDGTWIS